jgi:hypothetical protein
VFHVEKWMPNRARRRCGANNAHMWLPWRISVRGRATRDEQDSPAGEFLGCRRPCTAVPDLNSSSRCVPGFMAMAVVGRV